MMKHLLFSIIAIFLLSSCDGGKQKAAAEAKAAREKAVKDSIAQAEKDSIASLPRNRVGKYVYLDHYGVLHTSLHCRYINYVSSTEKEVTDDDGNLVAESSDVRHGSGIRRVLLENMILSMLSNACHYCVKDDMYDYLRTAIASDAFHEGKKSEQKKSLGIKWK